jgi:MFS family permease
VLAQSLRHGLGNPPVRWIMLAAPFTDGVSIFAFYAAQPYLLQLWGNEKAYGIAGLAAAVVAGAQIAGGLSVPLVRRIFRRRTTVLLSATIASTAILATIALVPFFWAAIALLMLWGLLFAAVNPVRQSYLNDLIPSEQRATVLSFGSLLGSAGGVVTQPLLGRAADLWSYPVSYGISAGIHSLAIPFLWIAGRHRVAADDMGLDRAKH